MNLKKLSITLGVVALGASVSAGAAQIIHYGDENDLSWLPTAVTTYQPAATGASVDAQKTQIIHYGDENDLSWLPTPARK